MVHFLQIWFVIDFVNKETIFSLGWGIMQNLETDANISKTTKLIQLAINYALNSGR